MIQALGRLYIASSRCEWYLGEIVYQAVLHTEKRKGWWDSTECLRQPTFIKIISDKVGSDISDCLIESLRLTEIVRVFRNRMIHGFLGAMNNTEGWIMLYKKDKTDEIGERINIDQVNFRLYRKCSGFGPYRLTISHHE